MIVTIEKKNKKTNEVIVNNVKIKCEHNVDEIGYNLTAVDKDDKEIGQLIFHVERQPKRQQNRVWLNYIEANRDYRRQSIGTALLTTMEYIALYHFGITKVMGVFNPRLPLLPITRKRRIEIIKGTKKFYQRNGYIVDTRNSGLSKSITKSLIEYTSMIDCSYAEMHSLKIDFDAVEEKINNY